MRKVLVLLALALVFGLAYAYAPEEAYAFPNLYDNNCLACHSDDAQTCAGCHAHGVHSSSAKNDINVTATTDKANYTPGEAMTVSVTGGYRAGWVRVILYDNTGAEVDRAQGPNCGTGGLDNGCGSGPEFPGPVVLNANAPAAPGDYTFTAAWYGNQFDAGGAAFGPNWTPDAGNPGHGEERVATNTFTVAAVSGPAISVTDSVAPADDQSVPFGNVTTGTTADQTVTVSNAGNADLVVGTVAQADPLAAPFSITTDNCSGQTVAPAASCTITVRFAPTALGAASDSFEIPSNDAATPTVTVQVSGTGASAAVPDIAVTDSVAPADDLQVGFGSVTVGNTSSAATVTIENAGAADLSVSGIALSGADSAEFALNLNGGSSPCGSATPAVAAGGSCTVTVAFAPASEGAKAASLDITSDDPDEASVSVALTGTGLAPGANNPPAAPALVAPANGQTGLSTTVTFHWNTASDPDGDPVTYDLFVCTDQTFAACPNPENSTPIASVGTGGGVKAAWALGVVALGAAFAGGLGRRRRIALLLVVALIAGAAFVACDGDVKVSVKSDRSFTVAGLDPATTYFWKVVATDGADSTDSSVRSFTTK
ncbi:MAG: hypothetical protein Kow0025_24610 [Thermodesulfovibrionales bacterium]